MVSSVCPGTICICTHKLIMKLIRTSSRVPMAYRYALAEIAQRVRYQASRVQRRRLRQCGDLKKSCNSPRPHAAQHEAPCVGRARGCAQKSDQPARQMLRNGAVTSVRGSVGDAPLSCSSKSKKSPTLFGRNAKCNLGALDGNRLGAAPRGEIRRVFRGYMSQSPGKKYTIKYIFKTLFNR